MSTEPHQTTPLVELKVLVAAEGEANEVLDTLGVARGDSKLRTVVFFDTPELALLTGNGSVREGLRAILRARLNEKKGTLETIVKLREEGILPDEIVHFSDATEREFDHAHGRTIMDSVVLKREDLEEADFDAALSEDGSPEDLFNQEQKRLLAAAVGGSFRWGRLIAFGPVRGVRVWREHSLKGFAPKVTAEHWELTPLGGRPGRTLVEVSSRVALADGMKLSKALVEAIKAVGLKVVEDGTKTQIVLKHFKPTTLLGAL